MVDRVCVSFFLNECNSRIFIALRVKDNLLITEKYNIQKERNRSERKEGITYGRYWKTEKVR